MLKLHFKDKRQAAFWVTEKLFCIGSAVDNQLVISDAGLDPIHAKLFAEDDKYLLKDNNSSSGCFINDQRITLKEVLPGDIIRLGTIEIIALDPRRGHGDSDHEAAPWHLVSDSSWLAGKTFVIPPRQTLTMGRSPDCDITIPGSHVARRHLELSINGKHLCIKDLGSNSGTFLNDKSIAQANAENGDRLRLDVYSFRVIAPETDTNATQLRPSIETIGKPIERKQVSDEPKRWITRPTSPGNRSEPSDNTASTSPWTWMLLGITLCGLAMIGSKFL
jgi:pSer/pThr/pTyr-binding forkhead associated (FHA) protein